jgi:hypothetical protein
MSGYARALTDHTGWQAQPVSGFKFKAASNVLQDEKLQPYVRYQSVAG